MTSSEEPGSDCLSHILLGQNQFKSLISHYWWIGHHFFFFHRWNCFNRQGTFVQVHFVQETWSCHPWLMLTWCVSLMAVHWCLSFLLSFNDQAESEYVSWHSTSSCVGEVFIRTWHNGAFFLFYVTFCFINKWFFFSFLPPWFFTCNLIYYSHID